MRVLVWHLHSAVGVVDSLELVSLPIATAAAVCAFVADFDMEMGRVNLVVGKLGKGDNIVESAFMLVSTAVFGHVVC